MQSQKLVSFFFRIYFIRLKMQSQKLVSFFLIYLIMVKKMSQIYELIFI
jgi:hypothetical protein